MIYLAYDLVRKNNKKRGNKMLKFDNVGTDREFQHLCQG